MRGNLPGSEKAEKKRNSEESELLINREHTCPACGKVFSSGSPLNELLAKTFILKEKVLLKLEQKNRTI